MSYNIDRNIIIKNIDARIKVRDVFDLLIKLKDSFPEGNFLGNLADSVSPTQPESYANINNFSWHGNWSGHSYDFLIKEVCPKIMGELEVVNIWEGGDNVDGFKIKDGVVTECDVNYNLKERRC